MVNSRHQTEIIFFLLSRFNHWQFCIIYRHDTAVIRKDEELTLLHDQMMILATVTHHATPAVLPSPATKSYRTKDAKKMHVATIPNQIDELKAKHAEEPIGRKVFKRKQDCLANTSEIIVPSQGVGAFKSRPTETTQQGTAQLPSTKTPVNPLPINPPNKIHQQAHNGRGGGSCPVCGDTAYGLMVRTCSAYTVHTLIHKNKNRVFLNELIFTEAMPARLPSRVPLCMCPSPNSH
jgi:hypothetical protein